MNDLQNVFSDFKTQVEEIAEHADAVQKLSFKAELKNGTSFKFSYNADTFGPRKQYHPTSIFNGILDIVSALVAIWLLVSFSIRMRSSESMVPALVLALSLATAVFVFSALYHFMSQEKRSSLVFANLKEICKILFLACINLAVAAIFNSTRLQITQSLSLVLVALSLLFLLGRTQLSSRVSLAITTLLPCIALLSALNLENVISTLLFSMWSLVALASKGESRMRTTSLFALIGLLSLASQLTARMI